MESSRDHHAQRVACWKIQDCGNCINSQHGCGWCPSSSTCVPAPSLLSPLQHQICPLPSERYELRTKALGCNCSTITLLSVLVTIVCTILGLLLAWLLVVAIKWLTRLLAPGGWELVREEDGGVKEGLWIRRGWWKVGGDGREIDGERRRLL